MPRALAFPLFGKAALEVRKLGCVVLSVVLAVVTGTGCDTRREHGTAAANANDRVELALSALDGTRVASADWRGRTVVLNVWASWCAPCRAEMASLEALSRAVDPAQVLVVGISVDDDRHLAREYLLREGFGFLNLFDDPQRPVQHDLRVVALPTTLVLDADGAVRARVAGARNWTEPALLEQLGIPLAGTALAPRAPDATPHPAQSPRT